jgi:Flp pilus assembly protein TadG
MIGERLRRREPAQVIVLFALSLIAMLAMVAVVLDGGTLYLQRRTAQNAADAAALAGARALQQATLSPTSAIPFEICKYVVANNFGATPTPTAYFVDINGSKITGGDIPLPTNCSGTVSSAAILTGSAGVHVDVTMGPYNTYLAGIVGLRQLSAGASASAQVWNFAIDAAYIAPWASCGPTAPTSTGGALTDILDTSTNTILQSAINAHVSVILQSSKMNAGGAGWLSAPPACPDDNGSSWKGKINPSGVISPPMNVSTSNGNGSVSAQCTATGQTDPNGPGECFLFVPVTDANNSSGQAHVVTFACMDVYPGGTGNDKWWGTLEPISACPTHPYKPQWTFGSSSSNTVVALTS